jgi:hypothetical protein
VLWILQANEIVLGLPVELILQQRVDHIVWRSDAFGQRSDSTEVVPQAAEGLDLGHTKDDR